MAAAGLSVAEVPSFELDRIHGESNLRTFRDGWRVLRTLMTERRRLVSRRPDTGSRTSQWVQRPTCKVMSCPRPPWGNRRHRWA